MINAEALLVDSAWKIRYKTLGEPFGNDQLARDLVEVGIALESLYIVRSRRSF